MARPTDFPDHDTGDVNSTTTDATIKANGWPELAQVPNASWNWLHRTVGLWVRYLDDVATTQFGVQHDISDGTHTAITADSAVVSGTITSARGITAGTPAEVGGSLDNQGQVGNLGTSTVNEIEGQTYDLPAGSLTVGTIIRVSTVAKVTWVTGTFHLRIRMGAVGDTVDDRAPLLAFLYVPVTGDVVDMHAYFRVSTAGATLVANGFARGFVARSAEFLLAQDRNNGDIGGEDGTAVLRFSPSCQFGTSNAGHSVDFRHFVVEIVGGGA